MNEPIRKPESGQASEDGPGAPRRPKFFRRRTGRILVWSSRALLAVVLAGLVYAYLHGPLGPNFHVVTEGPQAMYRSGQLHPDDLEERVKKYNIKTVLNLRGKSPGDDWYTGERQRAAELGIEFVSIAMSGRFLMSRDIMLQIIDVLETRPRPILVHCKAGVDRSGLISALERLLKDPADMEGARAQLAIFPYGHTGLGKAVRMDEFLDIYERYRQSGGKLGLRAWVETVYDPR